MYIIRVHVYDVKCILGFKTRCYTLRYISPQSRLLVAHARDSMCAKLCDSEWTRDSYDMQARIIYNTIIWRKSGDFSRVAGDRRRETEIKAFVVDTHTPYIRTKPIHLRRRIPPSSLPSPLLLAPRVVGKVLFSNKNLTNMPRFAEEWRRSAPPSPRFPPAVVTSTRVEVS